MESIKYIANPTYFGQDVWTSDGKIVVSESTTQKELESLYQAGHGAAIKVEVPEKPKK